jgi:hypothetical protein
MCRLLHNAYSNGRFHLFMVTLCGFIVQHVLKHNR